MGRHVHELRVRDGALVRRGWSGHHVHELGRAMHRSGHPVLGGGGWCTGQARPIRPPCAGGGCTGQARPVRPLCAGGVMRQSGEAIRPPCAGEWCTGQATG